MEYFAHETAVIDEGCEIGKGTKIWHFSHIMKEAKLGENCNLGQNVVVSPQVVLGNNVKVQNNVSIYTGVICEDDVFLGPSCVFNQCNQPSQRGEPTGRVQQYRESKKARPSAPTLPLFVATTLASLPSSGRAVWSPRKCRPMRWWWATPRGKWAG